MKVGAAGGMRAALIAGVAVAITVTPTASAARAQEAPLMVQTVPSIEGVELSLFGRAVTTDDHGLAVATNAPGTYELSTPVAGAGENVRWEFSGWSDGSDSSTRPVTVSSFTFLEAGYDVYHRASISLVADGGEVFPESLDSVTLVDDRGERVTLSGDEPGWLLAERAVETTAGFAPEEVGYRVHSVSAGGRQMSPSRAQRLRPAPGGLLEIEVTPAEGAGPPPVTPGVGPRPQGSSAGADQSRWPFVVLGAAAVGLLALAGRARIAAGASAGASALRGAGPVLRRRLTPAGPALAVAGQHIARGGRGVLRNSARLASSLADGASQSVRSAARLSVAGVARARGWVRSAARLSAAGVARARSWSARAGALATHASVASRSSARGFQISVRAAIASAVRSAGAATAGGVHAVGAAARSAAHTVVTALRGVRISAAVSAIEAITRRVASAAKSRARVRVPRSDAELGPAGRRELVRVTLLDGRVIEGWWERQAPGTGEDFFCLTHVSRVLEPDGRDTVSAPVDAFIPVAKIADIEPAVATPGVQSPPRADGADRADTVTSTPG